MHLDMKTWTHINIKLILAIILPLFLLQSCYISKNLNREVKVSFNSDFPININNTGTEGFSSAHTIAEFKEAYITGLKGEFSTSKIIVVEADAEFIVTINAFTIDETSTQETVNDANSSENGVTFTLTSIDNKSDGSIVSNTQESLGSWSAFKSRNEKVKDRVKKDDTTTHWEKDFTSGAALRFADAAGRRAGARIVNDIHSFLKKKSK